ncbi:hypothetical protein Tco_0627590 [Tanacetum coccineum]|uniref:Uncharacterized protein n=1 Tax=Tanacetum coccineum TaxID=301880 RepID=A0ABQ4WN11_9ASTR
MADSIFIALGPCESGVIANKMCSSIQLIVGAGGDNQISGKGEIEIISQKDIVAVRWNIGTFPTGYTKLLQRYPIGSEIDSGTAYSLQRACKCLGTITGAFRGPSEIDLIIDNWDQTSGGTLTGAYLLFSRQASCNVVTSVFTFHISCGVDEVNRNQWVQLLLKGEFSPQVDGKVLLLDEVTFRYFSRLALNLALAFTNSYGNLPLVQPLNLKGLELLIGETA